MTETRKYFGTDGIRGQANSFPMTADMALKTAMATALALKENTDCPRQNRAVIGKDTRLSGYMLEEAMCAGFVAMGMETVLVGPIPTPAIAMLTRSLRADVGVMISASHNPYQDNGIKMFAADGYKFSDDLERAVEHYIDTDMNAALPPPDKIGKALRLDDAPGRYIEFIKGSFSRHRTLEGLKIVVDCANGAAYKVAPRVLWELEADVISIGVAPNGRNINKDCGATDTAALQQKVVEEQADIGIALDGDADRLIVVDEKGNRVDGDQIMALLALSLKKRGSLQGDGVVATVMSNLGLERFLGQNDLFLHRTAVGDRAVVQAMKEHGFNVGGEQSGHLILSDHGTTGDGLLAALQLLIELVEQKIPASEMFHLFDPMPQTLRNIRFVPDVFERNDPLERDDVKEAISRAEQELGGNGRVLVRKSGTEPLVRIMVEAEDPALVERVLEPLCRIVEGTVPSARTGT